MFTANRPLRAIYTLTYCTLKRVVLRSGALNACRTNVLDAFSFGKQASAETSPHDGLVAVIVDGNLHAYVYTLILLLNIKQLSHHAIGTTVVHVMCVCVDAGAHSEHTRLSEYAQECQNARLVINNIRLAVAVQCCLTGVE